MEIRVLISAVFCVVYEVSGSFAQNRCHRYTAMKKFTLCSLDIYWTLRERRSSLSTNTSSVPCSPEDKVKACYEAALSSTNCHMVSEFSFHTTRLFPLIREIYLEICTWNREEGYTGGTLNDYSTICDIRVALTEFLECNINYFKRIQQESNRQQQQTNPWNETTSSDKQAEEELCASDAKYQRCIGTIPLHSECGVGTEIHSHITYLSNVVHQKLGTSCKNDTMSNVSECQQQLFIEKFLQCGVLRYEAGHDTSDESNCRSIDNYKRCILDAEAKTHCSGKVTDLQKHLQYLDGIMASPLNISCNVTYNPASKECNRTVLFSNYFSCGARVQKLTELSNLDTTGYCKTSESLKKCLMTAKEVSGCISPSDITQSMEALIQTWNKEYINKCQTNITAATTTAQESSCTSGPFLKKIFLCGLALGGDVKRQRVSSRSFMPEICHHIARIQNCLNDIENESSCSRSDISSHVSPVLLSLYSKYLNICENFPVRVNPQKSTLMTSVTCRRKTVIKKIFNCGLGFSKIIEKLSVMKRKAKFFCPLLRNYERCIPEAAEEEGCNEDPETNTHVKAFSRILQRQYYFSCIAKTIVKRKPQKLRRKKSLWQLQRRRRFPKVLHQLLRDDADSLVNPEIALKRLPKMEKQSYEYGFWPPYEDYVEEYEPEVTIPATRFTRKRVRHRSGRRLKKISSTSNPSSSSTISSTLLLKKMNFVNEAAVFTTLIYSSQFALSNDVSGGQFLEKLRRYNRYNYSEDAESLGQRNLRRDNTGKRLQQKRVLTQENVFQKRLLNDRPNNSRPNNRPRHATKDLHSNLQNSRSDIQDRYLKWEGFLKRNKQTSSDSQSQLKEKVFYRRDLDSRLRSQDSESVAKDHRRHRTINSNRESGQLSLRSKHRSELPYGPKTTNRSGQWNKRYFIPYRQRVNQAIQSRQLHRNFPRNNIPGGYRHQNREPYNRAPGKLGYHPSSAYGNHNGMPSYWQDFDKRNANKYQDYYDDPVIDKDSDDMNGLRDYRASDVYSPDSPYSDLNYEGSFNSDLYSEGINNPVISDEGSDFESGYKSQGMKPLKRMKRYEDDEMVIPRGIYEDFSDREEEPSLYDSPLINGYDYSGPGEAGGIPGNGVEFGHDSVIPRNGYVSDGSDLDYQPGLEEMKVPRLPAIQDSPVWNRSNKKSQLPRERYETFMDANREQAVGDTPFRNYFNKSGRIHDQKKLGRNPYGFADYPDIKPLDDEYDLYSAPRFDDHRALRPKVAESDRRRLAVDSAPELDNGKSETDRRNILDSARRHAGVQKHPRQPIDRPYFDSVNFRTNEPSERQERAGGRIRRTPDRRLMKHRPIDSGQRPHSFERSPRVSRKNHSNIHFPQDTKRDGPNGYPYRKLDYDDKGQEKRFNDFTSARTLEDVAVTTVNENVKHLQDLLPEKLHNDDRNIFRVARKISDSIYAKASSRPDQDKEFHNQKTDLDDSFPGDDIGSVLDKEDSPPRKAVLEDDYAGADERSLDLMDSAQMSPEQRRHMDNVDKRPMSFLEKIGKKKAWYTDDIWGDKHDDMSDIQRVVQASQIAGKLRKPERSRPISSETTDFDCQWASLRMRAEVCIEIFDSYVKNTSASRKRIRIKDMNKRLKKNLCSHANELRDCIVAFAKKFNCSEERVKLENLTAEHLADMGLAFCCSSISRAICWLLFCTLLICYMFYIKFS